MASALEMAFGGLRAIAKENVVQWNKENLLCILGATFILCDLRTSHVRSVPLRRLDIATG
jgi:hypothetical protein